MISSVGSLISVSATVLFLYVVYDMLVNRPAAIANAWGTPDYFFGAPTLEKTPSASTTVEWTLPSPTPYHAYLMMPVQS